MVPHSDSILIQNFELFKNFLAVSERINGLTQLHIINLQNNSSYYLAFDEPTYTARHWRQTQIIIPIRCVLIIRH